MFKNFKTRFKTLETGFLSVAVIAAGVNLVGCSLNSASTDLYGPFSVPAKYTFVIDPPEKESERNQSWLLTGFQTLEGANTPDERASVYTGLGLVYEELGLNFISRYMYMNSIVMNPKNPDAFSHLGYHFTLSDRIDDAVESYSALRELEKNSKNRYSYLDSAFTMYYTGHNEAASEDIEKYYSEASSDPYHMLWRYIIQSKSKGRKEALEDLRASYNTALDAISESGDKKRDWGFNLVELYLGIMSYDALFDDIKKSIDDDETFQSHLCEAYFYIAKLEQEKGYDKLCYDYLTLCLATLKYNFIEYRAAKLEVRNLKRRYHLLKKEQEDASLD